MPRTMMKAVRIHDYGGPEALSVEEVARPEAGAKQVLVRIFSSGVNPADWKMRAGLFKQFAPISMPWVPGLEGVGIVEVVGAGVHQFKTGQAVFGPFAGSYAEYAAVPAGDLRIKPASLSFAEAAGAPVGALTAWGALFDAGQAQAGQRVLVHGAAGGVGHFVVQLAKWRGAHVIGTASAGNLEFIRSLGVDDAIDYTVGPFEKTIRDVDLVVDTVGGDLPERSVAVLKPGGTLVTVAGMLSPDLGKAKGIKSVRAGRTAMANFDQVIRLIEAGTVRVVIGKTFTLADVRKAHELIQTGHGRGKIILQVADPQGKQE